MDNASIWIHNGILGPGTSEVGTDAPEALPEKRAAKPAEGDEKTEPQGKLTPLAFLGGPAQTFVSLPFACTRTE